MKNEILNFLAFKVPKEKGVFCFVNDIDPIFEELDSINSAYYSIGFFGLDNYIGLWKSKCI